MTHTQPANQPTVLMVGLEAKAQQFLTPLLKGVKVLTLTGLQAVELMDAPLESEPIMALVGPELKEPGALEVAQLLRMLWPQRALFYVSEQRRDYEVEQFIKNGFKDTFSLVVDATTLKAAVSAVLVQATGALAYKSVKLLDIQPETVLNFDAFVYLPINDESVNFFV